MSAAPRRAALAFTGALALACARGAPPPPVCERGVVLGGVGSAGVPVTRADAEVQAALSRTAGGTLTPAGALVDVLWQESERQRLGLPGGADTAESRRRVVSGHRDRLARGAVAPLRGSPSALPPGVWTTDCGRVWLGGG